MARAPVQEFAGVEPLASPPNDYQSINATPASFGGITAVAEQKGGAELEQGGAALGQTAIIRQERFNQVASDDAFNNLQKSYFNLTYGDPSDPTKKGFYSLRGDDAMRQYQPTLESLDTTRKQIRDGLANDHQRLEFDQASRRLQTFTMDSLGRHYDNQFNTYSIAVNQATEKVQLQQIGAQWNDDTSFQNSLEELKRAAVRKVQSAYGDKPDAALISSEIGRVTSDAVATRVQAWGPNDPAGAAAWLKQHQADITPHTYDTLLRQLEAHSDAATVAAGVQQITSGAAPAVAGGGIKAAITGQEGSGAASVSVNGARGTRQVTPATFAQYARPGESFDNEADRVTVSDRIIDDLSRRYSGDPARVAVGYFSGPGNVAPPGSATPWVEDKKDGNGTSTSAYVRGVLARMPAGGASSAQQAKPYVVGDSIAEGLRTAGGFDGSGQTGAAPDAVLRNVQALPPDQVRGRDIVLSTGASNNPAQVQLVSDQVAALQGKGAASVTLLGVGNRGDLAGVNDRLSAIAQQTGARFTPIPTGNLGPDQVHPSDYQSLASAVTQGRAATRESLIPPSYVDEAGMMARARQMASTMRPDLGERLINQTALEISRMNTLQDRANAAAEKARRDGAQDAGNSVVQQLIDIRTGKKDPSTFDPGVIANNPYLDYTQKWNLFQMSRTALAGEEAHDVKTYGSGFYSLYQRVHAPQGDANRITDPTELYGHVGPQGDLTVSGVEKLTQEITSRRTPQGESEAEMRKQFLANARSQITGTNEGLHLKDPKGDELFLKFMAQTLPAYDEGRKKGLSAAQLLDPSSKDYIGASVATFKRPMAAWVRDMMEQNEPGAVAGAASPGPSTTPTTREGIIAAFRAGTMTREQASAALVSGGFAAPAAAPTQAAPASAAPSLVPTQ